MNKTSEGALCNYVVTGVHTSGLTNQHKPLRKEEEGKEGPLLMVSGQCGRQLLQYVVTVVCGVKKTARRKIQDRNNAAQKWSLAEACFGFHSLLLWPKIWLIFLAFPSLLI